MKIKLRRMIAFILMLIMLSGVIGPENIMMLTAYAEEERPESTETSEPGAAGGDDAAETEVKDEEPTASQTAEPTEDPMPAASQPKAGEEANEPTREDSSDSPQTESKADESEAAYTTKPVELMKDMALTLSGDLPEGAAIGFEETEYEFDESKGSLLFAAKLNVTAAGESLKCEGSVTATLKGEAVRELLEADEVFSLIVNARGSEAKHLKAKDDTVSFRLTRFDLFVLYLEGEEETLEIPAQEPVDEPSADVITADGADAITADGEDAIAALTEEAATSVSDESEPSEQSLELSALTGELSPAATEGLDTSLASAPVSVTQSAAAAAAASYRMEQETVYLKDILSALNMSVKNNTKLSVTPAGLVTLSEDTYKNKNKDSITLTANTYFDEATLTIGSNTVTLSYPAPDELELIDYTAVSPLKPEAPADAIWANDVLYLTGKMPANAVVDCVPVEIEIDGEYVIAAYDIKIYANANQKAKGKQWQPNGNKVQVHFFAAESEDAVHVYHMADGTTTAQLVDTVTPNDGWVAFDAEHFSTYGFSFFEDLIGQTLDAALNKLLYKDTVFENDEIILTGNLPRNAIIEAKKVDVEIEGQDSILAYDIKIYQNSFFKLLGIVWQPKDGNPISVKVKSDAFAGRENVSIYHMADENAEPEFVTSVSVEDESVVFTAESFSIYPIVDHEGGEVVTPRVEFHFIAPVAEDYEPTITDNVAYYTSAPYTFNNQADETGAGNQQVTMIVRDGDTLESLEAPMNTQNTYFYGWYTVDKSANNVVFNSGTQTYSGTITYSWPLTDPLRVELDNTVSISAARDANNDITSITWTVYGVSGTSTDIDADGCAHVYLAPIYSNYYFVNFHLGARGETTAETLLSRKLIVLGNSNQTEVKISDVKAPSNDPVHVVFIGWEHDTGTEQSPVWTLERTIDENNEEIIQTGKDGVYLTVGPQTVDLYPYFVQARWVKFEVGAGSTGAQYQGPQLMFTSDTAVSDEYALESFGVPVRNGYSFGGWWTGENGTGTQITDANGYVLNSAYSVSGSYTDSNNNNYSGTAYEIKTTSGSHGKFYVYNALDELTLYAKWIANTTTTYKVIIWKQKVTDDKDAVDAEKTYDYYTHFERDFDYESNNNSFVVGTTAADRNYAVSNPNGDFTGFHLGRYDADTEIDPQGSTVLNVYYDRDLITLSFNIYDYTYTVSTNDNDDNPAKYGDVNGQKARVYWSYGAFRTSNSYYGTVYTGTVYTRSNNQSWNNYQTMTGLYGQTLGYNNYTWPSERLWYDGRNGNNTSGTNVTFIDTFKQNENYYSTSYVSSEYNTYNHYKQNVDGTWPGINEWANQTPKSGSATWNFTEKYEGFTVKYYYAGTANDAQNNWSNNWTAISAGDSVSSGNNSFYIRYARNTYDLTFSANYPPALSASEPSAQVFQNVPYEQSLASYSGTAAPALPSSDYFFDGWYEDASGTVPFNFTAGTMPAANKIIYAKWSLVEYPIHIDPNGGVIDHINYGHSSATGLAAATGLSGTPNGYSTYFDNTATQLIQPYNNLVRPYVEVSDAEAAQMAEGTVYRYVYTPLTGLEGGTKSGKLTSEARNAVYIKDTEESLAAYYNFYVAQVNKRNADKGDTMVPLPRAQWEATYVSTEKYRALRSGETYVFLAWYEVINGVRQSTPFDFSQPADHETWLVADWRLDGGYSLLYTTEYYADNNDYITANLSTWTDPLDGTSKYADGASTQAMQEPTSITVNGVESNEYQFRGWQIVRVETVGGRSRYTPLEPGVYYTAGQELVVQARYSDEYMIIHVQAVYEKRSEAYRRPDVISLTLDASEDAAHAGTGSVDSTNGTWPAWTYPGHYWSDGTKIYFGDTQSNTAVHLYKYATTLTESEVTGETLTPAGVNFFEHSAGYKLIGFDLDAPDTDFIPDFAADAVVAVSPGEEHTLYAVWEPMVYLNFVNNTGVGPVTFNLSGTGLSMYIVNQTNGSFSRIPLDTSQSVTVADGETIRLVVPYGVNETITISGTNTLGTGYLLSAKSELGYTSSVARTLTGTYSRVPNNESFSFSDSLVTDDEGVVITFYAEKAPHTLVLDDNYPGGGTREATFSETPSGTVYYQTESTTTYTLPSASTRIGWELLGWDVNPAATSPAYTTGAWTITDLTAFFTSDGSPLADIEIKTLYAIWKANADASTVYVWKNVPEPGDQSKDFTFTVSFSGGFQYTKSERYVRYYYYDWNPSTSSDTIAANTAQNNSATLTRDFTLTHNQYLKIVTVQNQNNGSRPYLKMTVTKWQRNSNGTPDTQLDVDSQTDGVQNEVVLSWYWKNETITDAPTYADQYKDFIFKNLSLSVTEADYTATYDLNVAVAAQTNAGLTANSAARKVTWDDTFAGGTVIFHNTRKTADVTIKKTLLPATADPENFTFSATLTNGESYVLSPTSKTIRSGASGAEGEWVIPGIPTGATLTITETVDADKYTTTAAAVTDDDGTTVSDADTMNDNIFRFTVTEDTTVTFTNTLISKKLRIVVIDDDSPANTLDSANFTFPGVFEGTKFSYADGVVGGTSYEAFVGTYTLTETSMPDHSGVRYIKLQSPVQVTVSGSGVSVPTGTANVSVSGPDSEGVYTITVVNPKLLRITVKKAIVHDYGSNSFLFTATLTDSSNNPIQMTNVYGTYGTDASGRLEFTLVNNQTSLLYVPRNAKLTVAETPDTWYDTEYQTGSDASDLGVAVSATSVNLTNITENGYVLFTNTRKMITLTVNKTVVGPGGEFTFHATVKNGDYVMTTYTGADGNGFTSGEKTFTLSPADNGTATTTLTIPAGSVLVLTETDLPAEPQYSTTTQVGSGTPVSGLAVTLTATQTVDDLTVTFTNTEIHVAPTAYTGGDHTGGYLWLLLMGALLAALAATNRRRRDGYDDEDTGRNRLIKPPDRRTDQTGPPGGQGRAIAPPPSGGALPGERAIAPPGVAASPQGEDKTAKGLSPQAAEQTAPISEAPKKAGTASSSPGRGAEARKIGRRAREKILSQVILTRIRGWPAARGDPAPIPRGRSGTNRLLREGG